MLTGRGFDVRHKEHHQKAKSDSPQSTFNFRFPSKESKESESRSRKILFQRLAPFTACGFINSSDNDILIKYIDEGGF